METAVDMGDCESEQQLDDDNTLTTSQPQPQTSSTDDTVVTLCLQQQMEDALRQSMLCQVTPTPATRTVDKSLLAAVTTEMTLFESRGVKGAVCS